MRQQSTVEGERRLVTVLFADLVGYTTMSEARDPEVIQEALEFCFDALCAEIRRFGGYVDKVVGDEVMALFGAPLAQEDDPGKAVAAGVAMIRKLQELTPELETRLGAGMSIRIGINTGMVVTGAVGPGGYTVTGDAVNVAARLEKASEPGAVMVGETTRRLARRQFVWGERQTLTVRGRTEPVVCFTAAELAEPLIRLVPAPSDTPFVGREEHIGRLRELWSAERRGRTLEIVGESGIGKTRLLAHFFSHADVRAEQILYARADTPPRTFGPLLQLLPALAAWLSPDSVQKLRALAHAGDAGETPAIDAGWMVDRLVEVVSALSASANVAFVLDDLHRADSATIDVVERLLPRIASLGVVTFLLRQPGGRKFKRQAAASSIALEPLDDAQARALVARSAPDLAEEQAREIVRRAGGNPLYLEVLSATASDRGAVPESLQAAVAARVDELDETSRLLLREASVFGQTFDEEAFRLTTSTPADMRPGLERLCEAGLLQRASDGARHSVQFRHSLVQEVLYHGLLRRRRVELHLRAAEALLSLRRERLNVTPEELAHHFEQAGESERAASYLLQAAERADQLSAPEQAKEHRRRASRLLNITSLAALYGGQRRPTLGARAASAAVQVLLAVLLILPVFVLFATRRPQADRLTIGLPTDIIDFNPASVLLAVVIGGVPLLVGGVIFSHLAAPSLMKRTVSRSTLAVAVAGGWALALACVALAYVALVALLRYDALDRLSGIYVGAATLQLMLGHYSLLVTAIVGTLLVAAVWTALLRFQARAWSHSRAVASPSPGDGDAERRRAALRHIGELVAVAGAVSLLAMLSYQFGLLPNRGDEQSLPSLAFGGLAISFAAVSAAGASAAWRTGRPGDRAATARQFGLFGFEVPLICALLFGLAAWFGMRQAVIVSANEVDTPGDIATFDRAVSLFPRLGLAYYLRGERHLAETAKVRGPSRDDEFRRARSDFDQAIERDPTFVASYLARSRVLVELRDFDAAAADGARVVQLRPEHPGGYAVRALAEYLRGDTAAASDDFNMATRPLTGDVRGWDVYFIRCLAFAGVKQYDNAVAECKRVLDVNPRQLVTLDALVNIAFAQGNYDDAIDYSARAIGVTPSSSVAWLNRGAAELALDRFEPAESDASRAIELDAENALAYRNRAVARLYLDRPDEAFADAERAVQLDRSEIQTRLFVARYTGRHDVAIADATAMLATADDEAKPFLLSSRGLSRAESGDPQQGIADITQALEANKDYGSGFERRAYAHFLAQDYTAAQSDFDAALRLLPTMSPEARAELHYHFGLLLRAQGKRDQAAAQANEARKEATIPATVHAIDDLESSVRS